jgi:DNA-binding transcriptional ArsR family regulator
VTRPAGDRGVFAADGHAFPGWRAWRRRDGTLAARLGGSPVPGSHACGATPDELIRAIEASCAPPPALRPAAATALAALSAAPEPLRVRQVSDASGITISTAAQALAELHALGLVTRRRDGQRAWLYCQAPATGRPADASNDIADA